MANIPDDKTEWERTLDSLAAFANEEEAKKPPVDWEKVRKKEKRDHILEERAKARCLDSVERGLGRQDRYIWKNRRAILKDKRYGGLVEMIAYTFTREEEKFVNRNCSVEARRKGRKNYGVQHDFLVLLAREQVQIWEEDRESRELENAGSMKTAPAKHLDVDLGDLNLAPDQARLVQAAANEYASWCARNGRATKEDDYFLLQRMTTALPEADWSTRGRILDRIIAAAKQPAK